MSEKTKTVAAEDVSRIDWPAIHRRLENATSVLEQKMAPAPEEKKKILKERAKTLAREEKDDGRREEQLEIVGLVAKYFTKEWDRVKQGEHTDV